MMVTAEGTEGTHRLVQHRVESVSFSKKVENTTKNQTEKIWSLICHWLSRLVLKLLRTAAGEVGGGPRQIVKTILPKARIQVKVLWHLAVASIPLKAIDGRLLKVLQPSVGLGEMGFESSSLVAWNQPHQAVVVDDDCAEITVKRMRQTPHQVRETLTLRQSQKMAKCLWIPRLRNQLTNLNIKRRMEMMALLKV